MTYDKTTQNKVLAYGEKHGVRKALRKFDISQVAYYNFKKRASSDYISPSRKTYFKKLDPTKLKQFVIENPDRTLKEMGEHFKVSHVSVWKALKKLNFSFKKRSFSTENEMKQNDQNTQKN
ncbi:IS630 transposase-related protein [Pseudolactococcus reticulitermitis]|uniref:Transposase Synechocystis PCC 6803 domain-containing protein n=1 Tax=Pseudolactococcus reticulitermitis TaxID=2025039 RepID=A0A224XE11_9LACT|nr:IS630 transposase-related protein [Lactococcus reticulitermitis]GAX47875.1 hypothetical protein RsY01_1479 [Lactococcus reticulitermitis]